MKRRQCLIYSLLFILFGCSEISPQASVTFQPEAVAKDTFTPTSTITSVPSITPHPTLSPEGPYLAFTINQGGPLVLMDANSIGRETINLPSRSKISDVKSSISSTGEWIAMHIGELYNPPYDLALILLNLKDGSIRQVANLLAGDYPDNLISIAEQIAESYPNPEVRSVDDWIVPVTMSFNEGINEIAWSPDGQQLAFSAQIDGPSSDLYVYNIEDESIIRITDDDNFIQEIDWSPNGDLILFQQAVVSQVYSLSSLHVSKADGSQIWNLDPADTLWWEIKGWASPYRIIVEHTGGDAAEPSELYYLDIQTDRRIPLWNDVFYDFAINPVSQVLVVSGVRNYQEDSLGDFQIGVFLVNPGEEIQMILQSVEPTWLSFIDNPSFNFVGCNEAGAFLINKDGSTNFLSNEKCYRLYISPDNNWIVVIHESGLAQVFTSEGEFTGEFQGFDLIWRPDSQGLFTISPDALSYISIPDIMISVAFECTEEEFPCYLLPEDFAWLP